MPQTWKWAAVATALFPINCCLLIFCFTSSSPFAGLLFGLALLVVVECVAAVIACGSELKRLVEGANFVSRPMFTFVMIVGALVGLGEDRCGSTGPFYIQN